MNPELQALKTAMDAGDFDTARELATDYVTAHPDEFTEHQTNTDNAETDHQAHQQAVKAVSAFRNAGMLDSQYRAEAWLLHTWEPLQIGAVMGPHRRTHTTSTITRRTHNQ